MQGKMGILRLYLAVCIIVSHSRPFGPFDWLGPAVAVQIFFIISGFYMELILSKKYTNTLTFFTNRFLRIFIPYWICFVLILLLCLICQTVFGNALTMKYYFDGSIKHSGLLGVCLAIFSNFTIFFQDLVMFISDEAGNGIAIIKSVKSNHFPLIHYLLLPQGWSVGVELLFYLCVPYLHKLKNHLLFFLIGISLLARIIAYEFFGVANAPWTYMFFPFEIALFAAGMLSCRLYFKFEKGRFLAAINNKISGITLFSVELLFLVVVSFLYQYLTSVTISTFSKYFTFFFTILVAFALPMLFLFSKNNAIDRFIGELSYPVYLIHVAIIRFLRIFFHTTLQQVLVAEMSTLFSIIFAIILYFTVIKPINNFRQKQIGVAQISA
jgi:peptidoglycan/LPS O-acetylase OafA/YrhL